MAVKFSNNFSTVLVSSISSSATVIELQSVSGLPTLAAGDHTYLTFDTDTNSPTIEIVKVTAINTTTNEVTVVRGQDNTSASAFAAGTAVELRMCAILLSEFLQEDGDGSNLTDVRAETVEVNVKNVSGGSLAKGTPVHQTGTSGAATFEVVAADASNASVMPAHFVLLETLADEAEGRGLLMGRISGVDTSSFSEGDTIYVAVGGGYTNVAPTGEGNLIQNLGTVTKVHASNGGGEVMGAGRSNATPNLNEGNIFLGNASNQAATASLSTSVSNLSHYNNANWDTAYGWGDHASAGYQAASTALTTSTTFGGDVSGTYNAIVVADDSHNHIISNVDGLQTALDGKVDLAGDTMTGTLNGTNFTASGDLTVSGDAELALIFLEDQNGTVSSRWGIYAWDDELQFTKRNLSTNAYAGAVLTLDYSTSQATFSGTISSGAITSTGTSTFAGIRVNNSNTALSQGGGNAVRITTNSGYVDVGPMNTSYSHFQTDRSNFYFGQPVHFGGQIYNYVGGGTSDPYWRAGNDGSGSGLDADLLDGQHASAFEPVNATILHQGSDIGNQDWNTFIDGTEASWNTVLNHSGSNRPSSAYTYGTALSFSKSGQAKLQIYAPETSSAGGTSAGMWYRTGWNTGYRDWQRIWDSGNDGSGSGLDADLLDGLQASQFLRSDAANNNYSHIINLRAGGNHLGNHEFAANTNQTAYSNSSIELREANYGGNATYSAPRISFHWGGVAASSISMNTSGDILIQNNPGTGYENLWAANIYDNSSRVWSAGNDGSGSGLDADLLDGIQSSSFLRSDTGDSWSGDIETTGTNRIRFGNAYQIDGNDGTIAAARFGTGLNIVGTQTTTGQGRVIRLWGSLITDQGHTYWHSANDGSGSGLDADLLDGIQGASFLRSDADDTFTGNLTTGSNNHITFGPNSTWGSSLRIGGNGRTATGTEMASIVTTDGNVHIDAAASNNGIYLNFYAGTAGVAFGDGALGVSAWVNTAGNMYRASLGNASNPYWHAANDGSGSGLDADLLDGIDSGSFVRSDANDTLSAQYSFTTTNNHAIRVGTIRGTAVGSQAGEFIQLYERVHIGSPNGWGQAATTGAPTYGLSVYGGANLATATGTVTIGGNTAWHAGNDGSGSGLDADLLDGYQLDGATSVATRIFNNKGQAHNTYTNFNTVMTPGPNYLQGGTNGPAAGQWYGFMLGLGSGYGTSTGSSGHYASQMYYPRAAQGNDPYLWFRDMESGAWGSWRKVYAGYADSAGNAGTLDGIDSSQFLRSDTSDTMSGELSVSGNIAINGSFGTGYPLAVSSSQRYMIGMRNTSADANYPWFFHETSSGQSALGIHFNAVGDKFLFREDGNAYFNGGVVYHSGNDGSGSGLDADLLDGDQGENYFRCKGDYPNTDMNTTVQGFWHVASNASNLPIAYYGHRWDWDHVKNGQWVFQMYSPTTGSADLWIRQKRNFVVQSWQKVWTSINDGAGSGLDADTVDGLQASQFLRSDASTGTSGTVLSVGPGSSNNIHVAIRHGAGSGDYGAVRFYQGGTNYQTIHGFSTAWQGGGLTNASTGAINLSGSSGVTFGPWNVPTGYVDNSGNAGFRGNVTAYAYSDIRLKHEIRPIFDDPLSKLMQLRGVRFDWDDEYVKSQHGDEDERWCPKHDVGMIAQEVKEVLPEITVEQDSGYLAIRYEKMIPLLVESIKELKAEVDDLKAQLKEK